MDKVIAFIKDWPNKKKALVPVAAAVVLAVTAYFGADSVVTTEVVLALTTAGVYTVKNVASKS